MNKITVFMTSQGSVYTVYNQNQTQRYQTVSNTTYVTSKRTLYLSHQEAKGVSIAMICGGWFKFRDDTFYIVHEGKAGNERPYFIDPALDLFPFEMWGEDLNHPHYVHLGSSIEHIF